MSVLLPKAIGDFLDSRPLVSKVLAVLGGSGHADVRR